MYVAMYGYLSYIEQNQPIGNLQIAAIKNALNVRIVYRMRISNPRVADRNDIFILIFLSCRYVFTREYIRAYARVKPRICITSICIFLSLFYSRV